MIIGIFVSSPTKKIFFFFFSPVNVSATAHARIPL